MLAAEKLVVRDLSGRHALQRRALNPSIFFTPMNQITSRGSHSQPVTHLPLSITSPSINGRHSIMRRQKIPNVRSKLGGGLDQRPKSHHISTSAGIIFPLVVDGKPHSLWEDRCHSHIPWHLSAHFGSAVCWRPMDWWSAYPISLFASEGSLAALSFLHQWL